MSEQKQTYLEQQLEAIMKKEGNNYTLTFQKGKIKLDDAAEMEMLKEIDPSIQKNITLSEDEVNLNIQPPPNYITYNQLKKKDDLSKWIFASQLVKKVRDHSLTRLHLFVSPENIFIDQSMTPYFLHYGVKESLPPYENDRERVWNETKAVVASAVDGKFEFGQYLSFHSTLELSPLAKSIMGAESESSLLELIRENTKLIEEKEKTLVHIPRKKWKLTRYMTIGLFTLFVPAFIYALYTLIFAEPKHAAFINSQEHFLESEYSDVVSILERYDIEDMPKVVQYELALSYIINESLTEEQKEYIRNTISLQSDPMYYQYWILVGRGNAKEAMDIARSLEDRFLIAYGLVQYSEEIKANEKMSGEEKQQELEKIESEIDEYKEELKQKEEEEAELEKEQTPKQSEEKPAAEDKAGATDEAEPTKADNPDPAAADAAPKKEDGAKTEAPPAQN
ncbi:type VII secretion protein EssB [Mesobacillus zeae]|uniref:Type VII secretion protein EssB n=1 Tax=Mesobacillus zeae TaxID=1917180 RepID=A0A398B271_9BACI|nr:type VII secretion protein EssB [Mesobacillus zeae]RID81906.1 type VII secretion protein EssB [Mesobacillus zeae]